MTRKIKHTPLPWRVSDRSEIRIKATVNGERTTLAEVFSKENKEDAIFIVRACNNFYKMIQLLEEIRKYMAPEISEREGNFVKTIDTVISEARGISNERTI